MSPETENLNNANAESATGAASLMDRLRGRMQKATRSRRGRKRMPALLHSGNLVLVVVFAAGLGLVYLMSLRSGPQRASAEQLLAETQVENELTRQQSTVAADSADQDIDIANVFYYEARHRQIPADELWRNVFQLTLPMQAVDDPNTEIVDTSTEDEETRAALEAAQRMVLQSIVAGGGNSTAVISDQFLHVGDTIGGWQVQSIGDNSVVLTWRDQQAILRIPE